MAPHRARRLAAAALLIILAAPQARAHQSFANLGLQAGSGSLAEQALSGQYGFAPQTPFYLYGELSHGVFYAAPDDNSLKGLLEAGYESAHLGAALRGGYQMGAFQSLSMLQLGGTILYRFARWNEATEGQKSFLSPEQRKRLEQKYAQETEADLPNATLGGLDVDRFAVSSSLSGKSVNPLRFGLWARAQLKPYLVFRPRITYSLYDVEPDTDTAGNRTYSSRALRLTRLGPPGLYSGIYGLPSYSVHLQADLKIFEQLYGSVALSRVSLKAPSYIGYSLYLAFDRFLTDDKRWAVSPSYEHYFLEGQQLSYFTICVRLGAAGFYIPEHNAAL